MKDLDLVNKAKFRIWILFLAMFCSLSPVCGQDITVSGTVKDDKGSPIAGATVLVKGTFQGINTDTYGKYTLKAAPDAVLTFSFMGFSPQEIAVSGRTTVDAILKEEAADIDEVVVIGYGTVRKSDLTGSVGSVKLGEIEEKGYTNFQQILGGKIAGVVVNENSGMPGSGLSIEVRGAASLNYSTQPLYVIDGIPVDIPDMSALSNTYTGGSTTNPLAMINANDIATMEVLKDASATAIYGSRGSNGVVLITTKSGEAGKTKLSVGYSHSFSDLAMDYDMLCATDYADMVNTFRASRNYKEVGYTPEEIASLQEYNHVDAITRIGQTRNLNISASGGDSKSKFYLSGQYFNQDGSVINTNLTRYSAKLNYERELFRGLRANINVTGTRTLQKGTNVSGWGGGYLNNVLGWAPNVPLYNPDGSYNVLGNYMYGTEGTYESQDFGTLYIKERFRESITDQLADMAQYSYFNPLQYLNTFVNNTTSNNFAGIFGLRYELGKNWVLAGKTSATLFNSLNETYRPISIPSPGASWRGMAAIGNVQSLKMLHEFTVSFNYKMSRHYLSGVVGATAEKFEQKTQTESTQGFTNDFTGPYLIEAGTLLQAPSSLVTNYSLVSFLGRINYHYNYKYYLTLSARYDGSSKFAKGNRFGFFPSAALSWRMKKENFLKDVDFIHDLKLRASVGVTGNQAIGSYNTLSILGSGDKDPDHKYNTTFGGVVNAGYAPAKFVNKDLKWERNVQYNLGVDLSLFKGRMNATVDLYRKYTNNLLYNVTIPLTTGFQTMVANVGKMENEGLEITLGATPVATKNFQWSVDFNIGFNRNKVTRLSGSEGPGFYYEYGILNKGFNGITRIEVGQPIGRLFAYEALPVWNYESIVNKPSTFQPTAKEGDRRYKDQPTEDHPEGDGILDKNDAVCVGSAIPDFTGGFSTNLRFKNLEFSMLFSFSYGAKAYNYFERDFFQLNGSVRPFQSVYDRRYVPLTADMTQEEKIAQSRINMTTKINAVSAAASDRREVSDINISDASFLRCKDITLGYTLPARMTRAIRLSSIKVYFTVSNPFLISDYSGSNPEAATSTGMVRGVDYGAYPLARTYKLGISFNY